MAQTEMALDSALSHEDITNGADTVDGQTVGVDQKLERASHMIVPYLMERVAEFRELNALRQAGWNNPGGDKFFQRQRQTADACDEKTAQYFYIMMKNIAHELHISTGAFKIRQAAGSEPPSILDICMAPVGFLATALEHNPTSHALAFSLPVSNGGHKVRLPRRLNVEQRFLDVTMLAADMGMSDIPQAHPEAESFMPRQFEPNQLFDLVLCDGQVLRTHVRAPYRENQEARRLSSTQLALGLEHLRPGGTMVILMHRLEAWNSVNLLRTSHEFSSVRLFKPMAGHAKRSSFYMIATGVQSQHPEAVRSIERWKAIWRTTTFGGDDERWEALSDRDLSVEQLLDQFGEKLIRLGREIWKVQAEALATAPFIRGKVGASERAKRTG